MISVVFDGSRFPVGSCTAGSSGCRRAPARSRRAAVRRRKAPTETRAPCCESPTRSSDGGTMRITSLVRVPVDLERERDVLQTVLCESSLKSWNTTPMLRRSFGTRRAAACRPGCRRRRPDRSSQLFTVQQLEQRRLSVPEWPTRKTKLLFDLEIDRRRALAFHSDRRAKRRGD